MGRKSFLAPGLIALIMLFGFLGQGGAEERYVVKPGDSLYVVSKARGVSIEALKRANQLKRDRIKPGQVLLILTPGSQKRDQTHPGIPVENGEDETLIGPPRPPLQVSSSVQEIKKVYPYRHPGPQASQDLIVQRPTPDGEEEALGDGGALSALSLYDQEEAKEPPAQAEMHSGRTKPSREGRKDVFRCSIPFGRIDAQGSRLFSSGEKDL